MISQKSLLELLPERRNLLTTLGLAAVGTATAFAWKNWSQPPPHSSTGTGVSNSSNSSSEPELDMDVIVVGAGFGGMCAAIKLREAGFKVTVLEKAHAFGGTWNFNTYPGVACDVAAHLYSFSFRKNPNWSLPYAPGPEIYDYCQQVAKEYDLYSCTQFGFEVVDCKWDEESAVWHITSVDGEVKTARIAIWAVGPLHEPNYPQFPGRENFEGIEMHSAAWDDDKYDQLTGKDVIVVGSAASAVQLIPHVAERAKNLHVIQRSPNWIAPQRTAFLPDPEHGYPEWLKTAFNYIPGLTTLHRLLIFINMEILSSPLNVLSAPSKYDPGQKYVTHFVKQFMLNQIKNDKTGTLKDKVIPDYPVGCKRILRSENYLKCLAENDHVELVTSGVKQVERDGLVTTDGTKIHADAIIYATGFKVGSIGKAQILGTKGHKITGTSVMDDSVEAYLGAAMKGYPNSFMLVGPNTGLGHNSIILMIESQVRYITGILKQMRQQKARRIEVTDEAMKRYYDYVWGAMDKSVWTTDHCSSWYQNKDGKVTTLWPATTMRFDWMTSNPDLAREFHVEKVGSKL